MANYVATIISAEFDVNATAKSGSQYKAYQIVYRDGSGVVRDLTKPMGSLKFNPALAQKLRGLHQNDVVTLVIDKNNQGFNELKDVIAGDSNDGVSPTAQVATAVNQPQAKSYGGGINDMARQVMIVKQSALNQAIAMGAKTPATAIDVAEQLVAWVVGDEKPTTDIPEADVPQKQKKPSKTKVAVDVDDEGFDDDIPY